MRRTCCKQRHGDDSTPRVSNDGVQGRRIDRPKHRRHRTGVKCGRMLDKRFVRESKAKQVGTDPHTSGPGRPELAAKNPQSRRGGAIIALLSQHRAGRRQGVALQRCINGVAVDRRSYAQASAQTRDVFAALLRCQLLWIMDYMCALAQLSTGSTPPDRQGTHRNACLIAEYDRSNIRECWSDSAMWTLIPYWMFAALL